MESRERPAPTRRVLREILRTEYDKEAGVVLLTVLWEGFPRPEYVCLGQEVLGGGAEWEVKVERDYGYSEFSDPHSGHYMESEGETVKEERSLSDFKWYSHLQEDEKCHIETISKPE